MKSGNLKQLYLKETTVDAKSTIYQCPKGNYESDILCCSIYCILKLLKLKSYQPLLLKRFVEDILTDLLKFQNCF